MQVTQKDNGFLFSLNMVNFVTLFVAILLL